MKADPNRALLTPIIERLEEGGAVTIAGLGDSLTYGWMVRRGFFDRFVDGLERRYPRAAIERVNAGLPGDTARGGLRRIGGVLQRSPQALVVQFALNDAFAGVGPDRFEQTLGEIARAALDAGAVPVLATSCPLVVESEQRLADAFYDAIRGAGRELGVPVAELARHWREAIDPGCLLDELFLADGVHPTDEGHQLMADGLLELFV